MANVRYIVEGIEEAIEFYERLGFEVQFHPGVTFRSEIIAGTGGRQVLADDPSGNPIELFQPSGRR